MALTMTEEMYNELDKFMAQKTITDVDRNTYIVCNLMDKRLKIEFSLVFMRDWDSIEADDYKEISIENNGSVLVFPCYWISVPKKLCRAYLEYVINTLYAETISQWDCYKNYVAAMGDGTETGGNVCPCPPAPQPKPVCPIITNNI